MFIYFSWVFVAVVQFIRIFNHIYVWRLKEKKHTVQKKKKKTDGHAHMRKFFAYFAKCSHIYGIAETCSESVSRMVCQHSMSNYVTHLKSLNKPLLRLKQVLQLLHIKIHGSSHMTQQHVLPVDLWMGHISITRISRAIALLHGHA